MMEDIDGHDINLSKNKVKDIGKECSGLRVSGDASVVASLEAEEYLDRLFSLAGRLAKHTGRKTIMEEDVREAAKIMNGEY